MPEHLPYTHSCFVCGIDNPHGLKLRFSTAGDDVRALFKPLSAHAGYAGLLHGGVIGAALDEAMFWAASHRAGRFQLSAELTVRYRSKVHVDGEYELVARVTRLMRSMCRTEAELLDAAGVVCASATGKYLPLPEADVALVLEDFYPDDDTVPVDRFLARDGG